MRVISGRARGTRLIAPKGMDIRPTLDRVREALFNILAPRIDGACFLDLFAGTGANGIEALSRGARAATFVDSDRRALTAIERNLEATKLYEYASVRKLVLPKGISALASKAMQFDVVFADPPYAFSDHKGLLAALQAARLIAQDAIIVVEHASRGKVEFDPEVFELSRRAEYGDTALTFFHLTQDVVSGTV
jgi:16S rRNA (guanine(966)-N(2))-methyltransferase RsmD